jgi:hypothetical protein
MAAITAPFPMTRGRVAALVIGVPACLALIGYNGLDLVANFGEANYPVSYAAPPGTRSLDVSVAAGQLSIRHTTAGQATLSGTARYSLVRSKLTERTTGSGTSIGYQCFLPVGDCHLDATINVPAALPVTANTDGGDATVTGTSGKVTLSSGGGNIAADHASGPLTLNTSGGSIQATAITSPTLTASTGGGNITATAVSSPVIAATTSGGSILVTGVRSDTVTAATGGGNIEIDFAGVPHDVQVNTSGGDITLVLPPGDTAYSVVAHADGGNVNDSLNHLSSSSPYRITATTGGGNITIRQQ